MGRQYGVKLLGMVGPGYVKELHTGPKNAYLKFNFLLMLFELSCEDENSGEIHISVDSENQDELVDWLEQVQEVAVVGSF